MAPPQCVIEHSHTASAHSSQRSTVDLGGLVASVRVPPGVGTSFELETILPVASLLVSPLNLRRRLVHEENTGLAGPA